MPRKILALASLAALLAACGDDNVEDPDAAQALWERLQTEGYRARWQRAPGWPERKASVASHGDEADIYVNATTVEALGQKGLGAWPTGALVVKDSYRGGSLRLVAAMEKRSDGWFYAEWTGSGEAKYAGQPSICTGCHSSGDDYVRAFGLPR